MSRTIAVLGAGPGLGRSIATRFGREGFRVALVARNKTRLDALVDDLAGQGVEAAAFPADLRDHQGIPSLVDAISARFGSLDVAYYGPSGLEPALLPVPVLDVDPDALDSHLDLMVRTPISLARAVLPGMRERGDGALLFGLGISAKIPVPLMGNIGIALAGLRNYIHNLHAVLAEEGVYAGAVLIAALIERSDAQRLFDADSTVRPSTEVERVDPDVLAELCWEMYRGRDRVEEVVGGFGRTNAEPA
ncbi:short chain dehydrogenase [Streptoalloteichus tenebrarius]|uniref:Short chain dehydrogenase n=1 Tax=Streptoalloteichus tenebrarius (strain ATCC 17920 / DSM 40477 / JCM 4838 / CBS 697.72 / NBRC 16177 / NCIMB 11028 / NRRL B-12390 / A12253. 1 / ISP 5477) TaxID=1933 RepID=A0ABT1HPZ5_STRSD|nr:SDR family NAD(P)-dependent oxidoreductase [Streptoalloteichus tenebrarius]MCP2257582.1 short chain dehydrogenase [Streptoalloteichus tenebrarius]BFE98537.1 SDR family NAD(P)-dependent oxidoreductase [Streptoalloteichus tenebrarius]